MSDQILKNWARSALVVAGAAVVATAAPAALAAGTGYGGSTATGAPATGFTTVAKVSTVGFSGATIRASVSGTTAKVVIPRGAISASLKVAVIDGKTSAVRRDLPTSLKRDKVVAALGVELQRGASSARTSKNVVLTLSSKDIARHDIVVVYNSRTGKFEKAFENGHAGKVTITLKKGHAYAVLAPRS